MSPLKDQTAIITGATSGIGRATAQELANAGMRLVLTGRREVRLRELSDEIGGAEIVAADVTEPAVPHRLLDAALQAHGRCDVVFNNAGIAHAGPIADIDIDKVCAMVRVNVEAAYRMAYVALKHFKAAGTGHLLNTSSVMGTKVRPTAGAYAGTKYAIEALSEALRIELAGTPIRVSCIEPGLVFTELHSDWEVHPKVSMNVPNPLTPEDIAKAVRYILEQPAHVRIPRLMMLPGEHAV